MKLMKKKYQNKVICFDIDGVICKTNGLNYKNSKPIVKNIKRINNLYFKGFYIKIFTARYMGRSAENIRLAKKKGLNLTTNQFKKWGLKYHKLIFGKPTYDFFVDDKNLLHKSNWYKYILKNKKN